MAEILVRNLNPDIVDRLKARARQHGRSLQAEVQRILEEAAGRRMEDARALADRIRASLVGLPHSDSVELLAEDRAR
jgi:plasmid stability protein